MPDLGFSSQNLYPWHTASKGNRFRTKHSKERSESGYRQWVLRFNSLTALLERPTNSGLDIQQQPCGILERLLDRHQRQHGFAAVDDAVVVGEREVVDRTDHDLAVF